MPCYSVQYIRDSQVKTTKTRLAHHVRWPYWVGGQSRWRIVRVWWGHTKLPYVKRTPFHALGLSSRRRYAQDTVASHHCGGCCGWQPCHVHLAAVQCRVIGITYSYKYKYLKIGLLWGSKGGGGALQETRSIIIHRVCLSFFTSVYQGQNLIEESNCEVAMILLRETMHIRI